MPLVKKVDVKAYFATRRTMMGAKAMSSSHPDATGFSGRQPDQSKSKVFNRADDVIQKDFASRVSVKVVATPETSRENQQP